MRTELRTAHGIALLSSQTSRRLFRPELRATTFRCSGCGTRTPEQFHGGRRFAAQEGIRPKPCTPARQRGPGGGGSGVHAMTPQSDASASGTVRALSRRRTRTKQGSWVRRHTALGDSARGVLYVHLDLFRCHDHPDWAGPDMCPWRLEREAPERNGANTRAAQLRRARGMRTWMRWARITRNVSCAL